MTEHDYRLTSISPIDGRYATKTDRLSRYFSEQALIKYRLMMEIEYFIELCNLPLPQLIDFPNNKYIELRSVYQNFTIKQAVRIKEIEKTTNHDVKAVEYYIKDVFQMLGISKYKEFIHFGLTSQDINNTAIPLSIKDALNEVYLPELEILVRYLLTLANEWRYIPLLARTHGQPASPTKLGKEISVFIERLVHQINNIATIPHAAKFGGATGNFNSHTVAYPSIDWRIFAKKFLYKFGLHHSFPTTQIEHYDYMAALFDNMRRINTILIDLNRDMWTYISMDYFKQKLKEGEIGSSAMPHKVNPIDFENSEGNLGIANALFTHLSTNLPISRLQRDLTDSTVLRNVGVPFAHSIIAIKSTVRGLEKLILNETKIIRDLDENWMVVSEGIQTILRREGYENPYEILKTLTRTNSTITKSQVMTFIDSLNVDLVVKNELKAITPRNYTGI